MIVAEEAWYRETVHRYNSKYDSSQHECNEWKVVDWTRLGALLNLLLWYTNSSTFFCIHSVNVLNEESVSYSRCDEPNAKCVGGEGGEGDVRSSGTKGTYLIKFTRSRCTRHVSMVEGGDDQRGWFDVAPVSHTLLVIPVGPTKPHLLLHTRLEDTRLSPKKHSPWCAWRRN